MARTVYAVPRPPAVVVPPPNVIQITPADKKPEPLKTRRNEAAPGPLLKDRQSRPIFFITPTAADIKIKTTKTTAHEPVATVPKTLTVAVKATPSAPAVLSPLVRYPTVAHTPLSFTPKSIFRLAGRDAAPNPLVDRRISAHEPFVVSPKLQSIFVQPSVVVASPTIYLTQVTAQSPIQLNQQTLTVLANRDTAPDPLRTRRVIAHEITQKEQLVDSILTVADNRVPILNSVSAHSPIQKIMQVLTILARKDSAPDPLLTRRVIAHTILQKEMVTDNILITPDLGPIFNSAKAHDPLQKVMQVLSILTRRENNPDPLVTRRVIAHTITQSEMATESILATQDMVPFPMVSKRDAYTTPQAEQQVYTKLAYTDVAASILDPLLARKILAHDTVQKVQLTYSLLGNVEGAIPETTFTRAHDPIQLVMETLNILATRDAGPIFNSTKAHDPIQKAMQVYNLLASRDNAPDPLLTRRVIAHTILQKDMLTDSILITADRQAPYTYNVKAHSPVQLAMQTLAVLAAVEHIAPYSYKTIAHDPVQLVQLTKAILTYFDRAPESRKITAHEPGQPTFYPLSILAGIDYAPDPLSTRRVIAIDIAQSTQATESIFVAPIVTQYPAIYTTVHAHDPIQKIMQALSVVASQDRAPDPLLTRRIIAHSISQKEMLTDSILISADNVPPYSYNVQAHTPIQKLQQTLAILANRDYAPDPLVTRRIVAHNITQKEQLTDSILITADNQAIFNSARAHDPIQKVMQALSVLATSDYAPDPLNTRRVIAHTITQKDAVTASILTYVDRAPVISTTATKAHDPIQLVMEALSILAARDYAPDPLLTRKVVAFDLGQRDMVTYTKLAYADPQPISPLYPLLKRANIAHDPLQLVMETLAILASKDAAPYPLLRKMQTHDPLQFVMQTLAILARKENAPESRKIFAHDPIQLVMEAISILAATDRSPDPLSTRRIIAHDPLQATQETLPILTYADYKPDPLNTRRIIANDPIQLLQKTLAILGYQDRAPDPLSTRRVIAHELLQKQQQTYSLLAYADFFGNVDPLLTRKIYAHEPVQKLMEKLAILGYREITPYPLLQISKAHSPIQLDMRTYSYIAPRAPVPDPLLRRILAHDPGQRSMAAVPVLIRPDNAPQPLLARLVRAHDPLQLSMETTNLLVIADRTTDSIFARKVTAFDPKQKIMEPFFLVGIKENTPYPLLTRLITAHEPTQKYLLSRWVQGYGFSSANVIHKFSGEILGRMWVAYYGRGWDGTEQKLWEGLEGRAWYGRYQRKWRR